MSQGIVDKTNSMTELKILVLIAVLQPLPIGKKTNFIQCIAKNKTSTLSSDGTAYNYPIRSVIELNGIIPGRTSKVTSNRNDGIFQMKTFISFDDENNENQRPPNRPIDPFKPALSHQSSVGTPRLSGSIHSN